ncbi:UNVERIFIED_CONTAM: LPXTG cell wall anchor domain-containing protein [Streptococcus canis]|uniref:LPXTG cell wall anchor domain-containing protein n=1 Tax=Streptococcus canis TaxID=1329 RepID=A0AAE4Q4W3_STRCB|nr:LPXTG cell wall anchor domain-containing protein [Streptococcus canis]MDV5977019.1 LPXTG cell wall anchor domain-containing protein [Streptococcus canis]
MSNKKVYLSSIIVLATLVYGPNTVTAEQFSTGKVSSYQASLVEGELTAQESLKQWQPQAGESSKASFEDFPEDSQTQEAPLDSKVEFEPIPEIAEVEPISLDSGQARSSESEKPELKALPIVPRNEEINWAAAANTRLPISEEDSLEIDNPKPHVRSLPSLTFQYMVAKHNLNQKMDALNQATKKLALLMTQKPDLTTRVYTIGHTFGEVLATHYEKKIVYKSKPSNQTVGTPSAIIDELRKLISHIGDSKEEITVPYNRKINIITVKKKVSLPATGGKVSLSLTLLGLASLITAPAMALRHTNKLGDFD